MHNAQSLSSQAIVERIHGFLRDVSPGHAGKAITPETRLRGDLGLDSVASLELLSMIDDAFGLEIEIEEVAGIETVGGIVALAETRVRARSGDA